jgi:hypothetical protein
MSSAALGDVELAIKDGGKEENGGNDPIIEHTMTLEEVLKRHSTNLKVITLTRIFCIDISFHLFIIENIAIFRS